MDVHERQITYYETEDGKQPFFEWFDSLRDQRAQAKIQARLDRVSLGNLGIAIQLGAVFWNSKLITAQVTASISDKSVTSSLFSFAEETRAVRSGTLKRLWNIGMITGGKMTKGQTKKRDYREDLIARLKDSKYAVEYLRASLEESDMPEVFLVALRNVAEAKGISKLAKDAHLNRENLYKMLSKEGNPELGSLYSILNALGFKLSVDVKEAS